MTDSAPQPTRWVETACGACAGAGGDYSGPCPDCRGQGVLPVPVATAPAAAASAAMPVLPPVDHVNDLDWSLACPSARCWVRTAGWARWDGAAWAIESQPALVAAGSLHACRLRS